MAVWSPDINLEGCTCTGLYLQLKHVYLNCVFSNLCAILYQHEHTSWAIAVVKLDFQVYSFTCIYMSNL